MEKDSTELKDKLIHTKSLLKLRNINRAVLQARIGLILISYLSGKNSLNTCINLKKFIHLNEGKKCSK